MGGYLFKEKPDPFDFQLVPGSLPCDIWLLIFPLVGKHEDIPLIRKNAKIWLSYRTVSKQWHKCISQTNFSHFEFNLYRADLEVDKMLKLFKFSTLDLTQRPPGGGNWELSIDSLTNLKRLRIDRSTPQLWPGACRNQISRLTRLDRLTVVGKQVIPSSILLAMTKLRSLSLRPCRYLRTYQSLRNLNTLTNLRTLRVDSHSKILKVNLTGLTNLKALKIKARSKHLTTLEIDISALTNLRYLELDLPVVQNRWFKTLTNLKNLMRTHPPEVRI